MYCPQCGVEYREGFTKCSDCHVFLAPGVPPEAPDHGAAPEAPGYWVAPQTPDPQLDPVAVFESNDRFAIALAKGSLEDAGIPFWMQGDYIAKGLSPVSAPSCRFFVPKDREAEARELLEPLNSPQGEENNS